MTKWLSLPSQPRLRGELVVQQMKGITPYRYKPVLEFDVNFFEREKKDILGSSRYVRSFTSSSGTLLMFMLLYPTQFTSFS